MPETPNKHTWQNPDHAAGHHGDRPYWKRAHRDWRFWVGAFFVFAAMVVFVLRYSLVLLPRGQSYQPPAGVVTK
jgi:hypothetical protein